MFIGAPLAKLSQVLGARNDAVSPAALRYIFEMDEPAGSRIPETRVIYREDQVTSIEVAQCQLHTRRGPETTWTFIKESISLGNDPNGDVVLLDDDTVSRLHCRIFQTSGGYRIVDNDSTNGTWVDGTRIKEAFLRDGANVGVGRTELLFAVSSAQVPLVPSELHGLGSLVGKSPRMREIYMLLQQIAPSAASVLIEGESGSGKELVAQEIHRLSARAGGPFVVFDCGAVAPSLIESELFGHQAGSFTGAVQARLGLMEAAHGGTLFLDEIGELPISLQPNLLRAIERKEFRRIGDNKLTRVDVRVLAATNRQLREELKAKRFRSDLFYRLSVISIRLPPLRERLEDLPLLCSHLLQTGDSPGQTNADTITAIADDALSLLREHSWPGNVRELVNVLARACITAQGPVLRASDLPPELTPPSAPESVTFKQAKDKVVRSFARDYLVDLLEKNQFNISAAAREADIARNYFRTLMRKHEIASPSDLEDDDDLPRL